jgi:hypothetical protein
MIVQRVGGARLLLPDRLESELTLSYNYTSQVLCRGSL